MSLDVLLHTFLSSVIYKCQLPVVVAHVQGLACLSTSDACSTPGFDPSALQALHTAKRQQLENVNLLLVSTHQAALAKEAREQLALLCPLYAAVILEQSAYMQPGMRFQPHQDALFFEALYQVSTMFWPLTDHWSCRSTCICQLMQPVCGVCMTEMSNAKHSLRGVSKMLLAGHCGRHPAGL